MAYKRPLSSRRKGNRSVIESMMKEVHRDEPSTVTRAKHFGPGGKEAMLRAVALAKARKARGGKRRG